MTERERVRDTEPRTGGARAVGVYGTPERTSVEVGSTRDYDGDVTTARAVDRVRWGPVLAGIFAALSTLATLTVLGLAIGLSSFDAGDSAGPFGLGAGIWGALSTLISFFVGGFFAARTAAVGGHSNGILNGAMVWFVAIPLLLYALGSGIGALASTVGGIASTAVEAGATAAGAAANEAAENPALQATAAAGAQDAAGAIQATASALANSVDSQDVNNAANTAANTAWQTLLGLGLAAAAAIGGGYLGSRPVAVATTTTRRAV